MFCTHFLLKDALQKKGGALFVRQNLTSGSKSKVFVLEAYLYAYNLLQLPLPPYNLLQHLNVPTCNVTPKFYISVDATSPTFRHGGDNAMWADDMMKWDNAVHFIRRVNEICSTASGILHSIASAICNCCYGCRMGDAASSPPPLTCSAPSVYDVCALNPLNIIPARFVVCRWFGVSVEFWEQVVVSIYSSSFLTTKLDTMPAMILPALDDIISVGRSNPLRQLHTWKGNSSEVFDLMESQIQRVVKNVRIERVERCGVSHTWSVVYSSKTESETESNKCKTGAQNNSDKKRITETFDIIIFACPANAINEMTNSENNRNAGFRSKLFDAILPNIKYENQRDDNFIHGDIHACRGVIPSPMRAEVIQGRYTNYIAHHNSNCDGEIENTFILGTWVPSALGSSSRCKALTAQNEVHDFFVTYNPRKETTNVLQSTALVGHVDNSWAHPEFSFKNLFLSLCMPLLQGRHQVYYCGSYVTPGNGHDLSLLSGMVVAARCSGGYHPLRHQADGPTIRDFELLDGLLFRGAR